MLERVSPRNKPVSLFVTCIIDMIYPDTGMSVVRLLEHLGVEVRFPMAQTCCGQPAYNGGYQTDARKVARHFLKTFRDAEVIVTPSGSCASMVRHEYPALFVDDPQWLPAAERAASITWEFTEYLVDGLGVSDLGLKLPEPTCLAVHDACHGLRMLGLKHTARALLKHVGNVTLSEMNESDVCCGFGGLFSVKMPGISNAMLQTKIENIEASEAQVITTGDMSCIMQINGGLARKRSGKRVQHIADVLASGLPESDAHES